MQILFRGKKESQRDMWDIVWSDDAERDYHDILAFWSAHNYSETYSLKILREVERAEELLSLNPYIGRLKSQEGVEVREFLVLHNFSIVYEISDIVEILSFWDNRRNPDDMINKLQIS